MKNIEFKDPYNGKSNEEQLKEKRDEYIKRAIGEVLSDEKFQETIFKGTLHSMDMAGEENYTKEIWHMIHERVMKELMEKQGVTKNTKPETKNEISEEYGRRAAELIAERVPSFGDIGKIGWGKTEKVEE